MTSAEYVCLSVLRTKEIFADTSGKIANIMDNLSGEGRIKGVMIIMADSTISDDIIGNITAIYGIKDSEQIEWFKRR